MKLTGMMLARNEAHEIGLTARAALIWCDELVVLNHASVDKTERIIAELYADYGMRIRNFTRADQKWDEMQHRQEMLEAARFNGGTHFAIIDADEILTGNLLGTIRPMVEQCPAGSVLQLPFYYLRGSLTRFHSNGVWGNQLWITVAFADDPWWHWAGDTFHHRDPMGIPAYDGYQLIEHGQGGVMHLWGVDETRLAAKVRLYKMTERVRWPEKPLHEIEARYNLAFHGHPDPLFGTPETWTYSETPASWWTPYKHLMKFYDPSIEPWQPAECERLIEQHGRETFGGLTL